MGFNTVAKPLRNKQSNKKSKNKVKLQKNKLLSVKFVAPFAVIFGLVGAYFVFQSFAFTNKPGVCEAYNLKAWTTNLAQYDLQHTYDSDCSSMRNWTTASRPDVTLKTKHGNTDISVTMPTSLAGAIASVKVGNMEYISSGGHGAAFQWNFRADPTNVVGTECFNPTEAGTEADDTNQWSKKYPIDSSRRWDLTPFHGPSTSAILTWPANWTGKRNVTLPTKQTSILTRMAMFKSQGMVGVGCETTPADFPNRTPYNVSGSKTDTRNLSPYLLKKSVTMDPLGRGLENVFRVDGDLTVEPDAFMAGRKNFTSVLIAYLQEEFTNIEYVDLATGVARTAVAPKEAVDIRSKTSPVISTAEGNYAIGLYVPKGLCGTEYGAQYFVESYAPLATSKLIHERRRTMQVTYYENNVPSPENGMNRKYTTYWVVANRQLVIDTLRELNRRDDSGTGLSACQ